MKKLILLYILCLCTGISFAQCCFTIDIDWVTTDDGVPITDDNDNFVPMEIGGLLNTALENNAKVCLKINPDRNFVNVTLTEDVLVDNKEVNLGARIQIEVSGANSGFTMTGDSGDTKIAGENMGATRIFHSGEGSAISMEDCGNCVVESLQISGTTLGASALTVDEESSDCVVKNVLVTDVQEGIIIEGDHNTLSNLYFLRTAIDEEDCIPTDDDPCAVLLSSSQSNIIDGIMHRLSSGAITVKFDGACSENVVNITTEQEASVCTDNKPDLPTDSHPWGDPALYIPNPESVSNNIITVNLNGGRVYIENRVTFCDNNTINNFWEGGADFSCQGADPSVINQCAN